MRQYNARVYDTYDIMTLEYKSCVEILLTIVSKLLTLWRNVIEVSVKCHAYCQ